MSQTSTETIEKIELTAKPVSSQLPSRHHTREPLPAHVKAFKRSRTFMTSTGVNPLVAAASALFALMNRLRFNESYPDMAQLKANLVHEIKAFESEAIQRGYQDEDILVARYVLCVGLDEAIMQTSWGQQGHWHEAGLLYIFQGELWGGERIFTMLEHLLIEPSKHLELLQFIYLCLSLGCMGKYQHEPNGQQTLQSLLERLYRVIRQHKQVELRQLAKCYQPTHKLIRKPPLSKTLSRLSMATFGAMLLLQLGLTIGLQAGLAPIESNLLTISTQSLL